MKFRNEKKNSPRRGIEPRSPAWQAGILTTILPRTRWQHKDVNDIFNAHFYSFFINTDKLITVSAVCRTIPERYLFTDVQTTKKAFYTLTSFSSSQLACVAVVSVSITPFSSFLPRASFVLPPLGLEETAAWITGALWAKQFRANCETSADFLASRFARNATLVSLVS